MLTKPEVAKLVSVAVAATGQGARLNGKAVEALVTAWGTLMADLDYARCSAALRVLLQSQTWLPSVAEIRGTVLELERGAVRPGGEAWGTVLAAVRRWGAYRVPGVDFEFDDPVVGQCVTALGWQEICTSELPAAERARFIDLYDRLAKQTRREEQVPMLAAARATREVKQLAEAQERAEAQRVIRDERRLAERLNDQITSGSAINRVMLTLVPNTEEES